MDILAVTSGGIDILDDESPGLVQTVSKRVFMSSLIQDIFFFLHFGSVSFPQILKSISNMVTPYCPSPPYPTQR